MNTKQGVQFNLSLKPKFEQIILDTEKELMLEDLQKFAPVDNGQVSFENTYIYDDGETIEVNLYILNGTQNSIAFKTVPFFIIDSQKKPLIYEVFNLDEVGIIPAYSARPHKLKFQRENLLVANLPSEGCRIATKTDCTPIQTIKFEIDNLPALTSVDEREKYESFLQTTSFNRSGNVSVCCYESLMHDETIALTLFILNGTEKTIALGKLPITILDAQDKNVISEVFDMKEIIVAPYRANLQYLNLSLQNYENQEFDLSKIKILFK